MLNEFEKMVQDWENGPIPQVIIPEKEVPFDYNRHGYNENEIDEFMRCFLDDPYIPDEEKHIFFEDFVIEYLSNEEYAKSLYGHYVLFINNQWYGTVKYMRDSYNIGEPNDSRLLSQIKKNSD